MNKYAFKKNLPNGWKYVDEENDNIYFQKEINIKEKQIDEKTWLIGKTYYLVSKFNKQDVLSGNHIQYLQINHSN